jgi:hypothetical protein
VSFESGRGGSSFANSTRSTGTLSIFIARLLDWSSRLMASAIRWGDQPAHDARRDRWIGDQGLRVIRFAAADVMWDFESVVTAILIECRR